MSCIPTMEGTGMTGMGMGMAPGTENPIRTLTRIPAGYTRTRAHH